MANEEPFISIIIPTYNVSMYIDAAFSSILEQTIFPHLQVIFADDHSTDNTFEKIEAFAQAHPNVESYQLPVNTGAAGAPRNMALLHVKAPFVMFLDGDDRLGIAACETLYTAITQDDSLDLVAGDYETVDEDGETLYYKPEGIANGEKIDVARYPEKALILSQTFCRSIFRTALIQAMGQPFPERVLGQDTIFVCKYILGCRFIQYRSVLVTRYLQRRKKDKSISYNRNERYYGQLLEIYQQLFEVIRQCSGCIRVKFKDVLDYYLPALATDEMMSDAQKRNVLANWKWFAEIYRQYDIRPARSWIAAIANLLGDGHIESAAELLCEIGERERFLLASEEAKTWFLQQIDQLQYSLNKQKDEADLSLENCQAVLLKEHEAYEAVRAVLADEQIKLLAALKNEHDAYTNARRELAGEQKRHHACQEALAKEHAAYLAARRELVVEQEKMKTALVKERKAYLAVCKELENEKQGR